MWSLVRYLVNFFCFLKYLCRQITLYLCNIKTPLWHYLHPLQYIFFLLTFFTELRLLADCSGSPHWFCPPQLFHPIFLYIYSSFGKPHLNCSICDMLVYLSFCQCDSVFNTSLGGAALFQKLFKSFSFNKESFVPLFTSKTATNSVDIIIRTWFDKQLTVTIKWKLSKQISTVPWNLDN